MMSLFNVYFDRNFIQNITKISGSSYQIMIKEFEKKT